MLVRRDELGASGLSYIRERLAGGRMLSRLLLDGLDLEAGHVWAYLPPVMTNEQAVAFADGIITRLATGTPPEVFHRPDGRWEVVQNLVAPLMSEHVRTFLTREDRGVAVWEDPLHDAGDPWVHNHPDEPLFFLGDEVYYVLTHSVLSMAAVGEGLGVMEAWWGSPALLAARPAEALHPLTTPRTSIATRQLAPLVAHCRLLFFKAYDGEGYVIWSPQDAIDFAGATDSTADTVKPPKHGV